jgi:hypothetical protein
MIPVQVAILLCLIVDISGIILSFSRDEVSMAALWALVLLKDVTWFVDQSTIKILNKRLLEGEKK